ncbi:MAG: hypothetical protein ACMXYL_02155 [Candidatus Woesearchaeota archaeon]
MTLLDHIKGVIRPGHYNSLSDYLSVDSSRRATIDNLKDNLESRIKSNISMLVEDENRSNYQKMMDKIRLPLKRLVIKPKIDYDTAKYAVLSYLSNSYDNALKEHELSDSKGLLLYVTTPDDIIARLYPNYDDMGGRMRPNKFEKMIYDIKRELS